MDETDALASKMPLTELRPKLSNRLLAILSMEMVRLIDNPAKMEYVTTVGLLLQYARANGDYWIHNVPGMTRAEKNRLAEALENFWCGA